MCNSVVKYLSDDDRCFVANVVNDLINANEMFSKYDIYQAVRDELNHLPNYFSVKKEITSVINTVIDEAADNDHIYTSDFISRDGKIFAVYHDESMDVEEYGTTVTKSNNDTKENDSNNSNFTIGVDTQMKSICHPMTTQNRVVIPKVIMDEITKHNTMKVSVSNCGSYITVSADSTKFDRQLWLNCNGSLTFSIRDLVKDNPNMNAVKIFIDNIHNQIMIYPWVF